MLPIMDYRSMKTNFPTRPPNLLDTIAYQARKHVFAASVSGSAVMLLLLLVRELGGSATPSGRWTTAVVAVLALVAAAIPLGVVRSLPEPAAIEAALAPEQVRGRMERATVGHEFLLRGADPALVAHRREPAWRPDGGLVEVMAAERHGSALALDLSVGAPARVELGRWSFPGWFVTVDGEPVVIESSPAEVLAFDLPAGTHRVTAHMARPPVRGVGTAISLLTLLLLALRWSRSRR